MINRRTFLTIFFFAIFIGIDIVCLETMFIVGNSTGSRSSLLANTQEYIPPTLTVTESNKTKPIVENKTCTEGIIIKFDCSGCNAATVTKTHVDCSQYIETINSDSCSTYCPKVEEVKPTPKIEVPEYSPPARQACCKICSKGKACGDSCISRSYACHKGAGCACDA